MTDVVPKPASKTGRLPALLTDVTAGVTTGVLSLPQGMAFAVIANVPPQCGLYAMIVPTIVAAIFRDSPYMVTGSTNTSALVVGALLGTLPEVREHLADPVSVMLLITLIMGLVQVAAGCLRLGSLGRYVSKPVLVGFTIGAGALIIIGQLKNVLGLHGATAVLLFDEIGKLATHIPETDFRAVAVAAATLAVVWLCARGSRLIPGALLAICAAGAMTALLGWNAENGGIAMLGAVPRELPHLTTPAFSLSLFDDVLGPALAIALLGAVETISIGKAVSARANIKFFPNQELVAQGGGNIAGAFFGCMPSSASWTRSVVNMQMGARTRWAGALAGLTVLAFVVALAPWARFVPKAALGAVVLWIAACMIDLKTARRVWDWSRRDGAVMLITIVAILFLKIQYAIFIGIIASLLVLLHNAGKLHMSELVAVGDNHFHELEIDAQTGGAPLVLLQLEGDLFSGVMEELEDRLAQIAAHGARVIVIRLKRIHGLDASALETLASFAARFKAQGGRLLICGLRPEMYTRLSRSELRESLGAENLIPMEEKVHASVRKALQMARTHLDGSVPPGQSLMREIPEASQAFTSSL